MTIQKLDISKIKVANRIRKDMGELTELASSISFIGLLQPIGVRSDNQLVWGERRLRACQSLGWKSIDAIIDPTLDDASLAIQAEHDENTCRKEMLPSEKAAFAKLLEPMERKAARGRMVDGGKNKSGSAKLAEATSRSRIANAVGLSHGTLAKATTVIDQGDDELIEAMDSGKVSVDAAAAIAELPKEEQKIVVAMSEKEILATAKAIKQKKSDERVAKRRDELVKKAESASPKLIGNWEIINGDCIAELKKIAAETVRLVFTDPPYNIGIDYGNGEKSDELTDSEYVSWAGEWIRLCSKALTADGSMWVMINDEYVADYVQAIKKHGLHVRNWIIWYESFGVNCDNKFNRTHRHIIHAVKDEYSFVFNADAPRLRRPSARQTVYGDARANPDGKLLDDVWMHIPRVVGTSVERIPDFPTQLPVELVATIVDAASNPGDTVLDPFNGSGTTGAASIKSGRKYIGIELNKHFAEMATIRLRGEE